MTVPGKFIFPMINVAGVTEPNWATECPARGFYDPSLPIPYIPDPNIPPIVPNDGEIVLFMSTQWDAAINCTTTRNGTSGQIRYSIYGANDALIYTQDVNSGTAFFYEFPSSGGILLSNGYYGFKIIIKMATVGTLGIFRFSTKSGYAVNGWPVYEAHIKAPTLTALANAFDGQKALRYIKFYGDHNSLGNCNYFANGCSELVECQAGVSMNGLTHLGYAFQNTPKLDILTLPPSMPLLTTIYSAFQSCGLKISPPMPNSLPECTSARFAYQNMQRLTGTLYVPDMPKCTDLVYVAASIPNVTKTVFRGSYIPNNGTTIQLASACPMLEELDMSNGTWGKAGVSWAMANLIDGDSSLKILKLPSKIIATRSASNWGGGCNSLSTITTCPDWTESPNQVTPFTFKSVESFNQPTYNIRNGNLVFSTGSGTSLNKLRYLEIDWANCIPETNAININCLYCSFDQAELERIYSALPNITGYSFTGTLKFFGCPGYNASNRTIATNKGWLFANY